MLKFRNGKITTNTDWVQQPQKEYFMIGVILKRTTDIIMKTHRDVMVDMVKYPQQDIMSST